MTVKKTVKQRPLSKGNPFVMRNLPNEPYVKLQDLKPGDKFYGWDGIINVLIEVTADPLTPNTLSYVAKRMTSNDIYTRTFHGAGIQEIQFLRYRGRNKSSFLAGFNSAIYACLDIMTPQQKLDFGIQTHIDVYKKSLIAYEYWKNNIKERP